MFKLNPNPTFWAPVKITRPGEESEPIEFEFKHRTRTGLAEWQKTFSQQVPAPTEDDPKRTETVWRSDREIVPEYIVNWRKAINSKGEQEPWSVDAFLDLTENYPSSAVEVYAGYIAALTESKAKN